MFKDVAVVDYFFGGYLVDPNNSIFSRWQDETTMIADRWSTEHVQAVKDHFLTLAEEGHTQWRQRFEAGIKSSTPEYGELFIMNISQISRNYPTSKPLLPVSATNDESAVSTEATTLPESQENSPKTCCNTHLRVDNLNEIEEQYGGNTTIGDTVRAGYLPEWLENRQRASFEAYKSGENLKDAGKRIGEQYGNKAITGDTVRKDAEKHAARHGLELPKRKKGRPSTS